ncbi:MAG: 50S ribosomal protein L4 [Elusimicrobia bacterium]|nr:50S ribosomal protein L4 [Elusimicrobiota bacterium]
MEIKLFNFKGQEIGTHKLQEELFSQKPDIHLLHEAVKYYLANKRRGTASTKTRSEVSGGGKKPWRQKHTGRARHGSARSPIWRKGGVVFGPKPRSFRLDMPHKKRRQALIEALSSKYADGSVFLLENFQAQEAKTRQLKDIYNALGLGGKKVFFADDRRNDKFELAARNVKHAKLGLAKNLNAYDLLNSDAVVFSVSGLNALTTLLLKGDKI